MNKTGAIVNKKLPIVRNGWTLSDKDLALYAMLNDPVYMPELLWKDPQNREYAGCYRVRDYQYGLNRVQGSMKAITRAGYENYAIIACARSVGKTESEKVHAQIHAMWGNGENMLITAPELIHLLPLTDAIEDNLRASRICEEMLDKRGGKTGFTHRPFGADFLDGTKVVGRIPKITGTGVKGQHQPFLIIEEGQDYPEKGWIEVNETVNYDAVDSNGRERFRFWVYGVHSGDPRSGFAQRARQHVFTTIQVTRLQRPDWNRKQKEAAKAAYGGSSNSDYRRNVLGEPGGAASAYFVLARLMACVDQDRESAYNTEGYKEQHFQWEEFEDLGLDIADALDLPSGLKVVHGGMDVGLTNSPTVISLFAEVTIRKKRRLALVRRFTLERFRPKQIRTALYAIAWHFGGNLQSFGMDVTGLGFPMFQEIEDDELVPPHLLAVAHGYFFNAKVPVGVNPEYVTKDEKSGLLRDQYGSAVKEEYNELTGETRYITYQPFIGASTRYLREWVDSGELLLPFDPEVIADMKAETTQRVDKLAAATEHTRKPNAFHILDSQRAMAMARKHDVVEYVLQQAPQQAVLDMAL